MVIRELQLRTAYPEACFQATTAQECAAAMRDWSTRVYTTADISLRDAIQVFCSDHVVPSIRCELANLGPLNLFVIISGKHNLTENFEQPFCSALLALHILIFQRMNSFGDSGNVGAIQNALHNWQSVWELYITGYSFRPPHVMLDSDSASLDPQDMWRRVGFMQHAHEFWLLANLIVDRMSTKSILEFSRHSIISGHGPVADPVLHQYDQNNMQQVNELITNFEQARIL